MKQITHVIFDFDGTIADTRLCIIRSFQHALDAMNLPAVDDAEIQALIGLPLREMFFRLGGLSRVEEQDKAMEIYRAYFDTIYLECVDLFDGVRDTLEMLFFGKDIVMGVATGRNKDSLYNMVCALEIGDFFHGMYSDDDVVEKKPAPEMANRLIADWGVDPDAVLVVGDTIYDIEMGQRAGCRTCGVSYGNHSAEQLTKQGADNVISQMAELLDLF